MSEEQKPVAWHYKKEGGGWFVSDNEPQYVEQWNDIEESKPLYTHPVPDVVKQLVEALAATKAWLDAEENHEFEPDFWKRANMARTAQNLVNAALAAAKEAGL